MFISSYHHKAWKLERPVPESEPGIPVPVSVPEPGNKVGQNREIWPYKLAEYAIFSGKKTVLMLIKKYHKIYNYIFLI